MAQLVTELMTPEPTASPGTVTIRDAAEVMRVQDVGDEVVTAAPDEEAETVIARMREHPVRRIPIVDGDRPMGVLSLGDAAMDRDPRSALADISNAPANT